MTLEHTQFKKWLILEERYDVQKFSLIQTAGTNIFFLLLLIPKCNLSVVIKNTDQNLSLNLHY